MASKDDMKTLIKEARQAYLGFLLELRMLRKRRNQMFQEAMKEIDKKKIEKMKQRLGI